MLAALPASPVECKAMSQQILLVDDDALLRRGLRYTLEQAGYAVRDAGTAEAGLELVRQLPPDLILLDVGLPGMDGLQALRELQREHEIPVIFLSARRRELDEILGLELGADDYITKPYDPDVLMARVRAVLRRAGRHNGPAAEGPIAVGDLVIDPAAHTVMVGDRPVQLAAREFALLLALARQAGHVVSLDELIREVWGAEFSGEPQVVYVHTRWLREKLETDPQNPVRILTVRGAGYKLVAPEA